MLKKVVVIVALVAAMAGGVVVAQLTDEQIAARREIAERWIAAHPAETWDKLNEVGVSKIEVIAWIRQQARIERTRVARPQVESLVLSGVLPQSVLDNFDAGTAEGAAE